MGTYSFYLATRGGAAECKINWSAMNTDVLFKCRVLERCYLQALTLEAVAKEFNESKLFGYLDYDLVSALFEFNRHLVPVPGTVATASAHGPRIYYSYEGSNTAYGLEFHPGTETLKLLCFDYNHLLSQDWSWEEYHKITESLPDRDGWELEELGSE